MRLAFAFALALFAAESSAATFKLTQIHMSWPLDQSGNAFRLSTSESAYLEFATTPGAFSVSFDVAADANANVAALVADMRNGVDDMLMLSIGSHSNGDSESWYFGAIDAVDGTGLRRIDYATRDWSAFVTGVDWSLFEIHGFHVSAAGPISATLPDRARVVIDVLGRVPEPSALLLLSTAAPLLFRCRSRPRGR